MSDEAYVKIGGRTVAAGWFAGLLIIAGVAMIFFAGFVVGSVV